MYTPRQTPRVIHPEDSSFRRLCLGVLLALVGAVAAAYNWEQAWLSQAGSADEYVLLGLALFSFGTWNVISLLHASRPAPPLSPRQSNSAMLL